MYKINTTHIQIIPEHQIFTLPPFPLDSEGKGVVKAFLTDSTLTNVIFITLGKNTNTNYH